ncbi:NADP-dependent oxidoreductase [Nakamurella endophytica]|uniref:NADPH:quinone reductase n=1 Tax=Nakamurella endophytica TaxID=1748367 RepID=A0A917W9B3_9ACTN|nr:NADP-dependent oxidoreductase [Nakamurella endophytica]GGL84721.1 NADPH:quinone reductase [Nakamurella endophytica]
MPRAVQRDGYGGVDVLEVREVPARTAGPGEVVVEVVAAGLNPGEAAIRAGVFADRWPSTFPEGQGSDLAGRVTAVGPGVVDVAVGDEVIGFTDERRSQADEVVLPAGNLTPRPAGVPWEVAGALFVAGTTAVAAVRAVAAQAGETAVVSGAAGGVGSLVVQLLAGAGVRVLGLAGPDHHDWLRAHGVEPVDYRGDVAASIRERTPDGIDAFVDTFGGGYVDLAVELGVAPERIDTVADFAAAARHPGVRTDGNAAAATAEVLAEVAGLVADGRLEVPIAATYPLEQVRDAYTDLERRHTLGKIVLLTGR